MSGFAHPALFYRDPQEYLAGTVPFVRAGLAVGEPVAVAVPGPQLDLLADALGPDVGRATLIDMGAAGRNPGRIIATVLHAFADQHPGRRTRIIGEPIWPGRTDTEYPACLQHEALINFAFADRDVTILCPYDVTNLDKSVISDAETTHPVLIDDTGERSSDRFDVAAALIAGNAPLPPRPRTTEVMFRAETVRAARGYAVAQAQRSGMVEARLVDVQLVVSELASNSIKHGGGSGSLWVWRDQHHLVCEVRDAGVFADPLAGRAPVSSDKHGGRGLLLVHRLADLIRIHTTPDATTVRAYLHLDPG